MHNHNVMHNERLTVTNLFMTEEVECNLYIVKLVKSRVASFTRLKQHTHSTLTYEPVPCTVYIPRVFTIFSFHSMFVRA